MNKYIVGIGAANVDIYGSSSLEIRRHFDHPATIKTGVGGVTRNILENISRLGLNTKLLTAVGDDIYGDLIKEVSNKAGIDTDHVLTVRNGRTGLFMQVMDNHNDMELALCDMSICEKINVSYIKKKAKLIKGAEALIIDPSLKKEVLDYIFDTFADVPIFLDPISDNYAISIKPHLSKIYCLKPNKSELEAMTDVKITNDEKLLEAYNKVIEKGVKKLYVSLGKEGCLYTNEKGEVVRTSLKPLEKMVNASGAGDSFFAAIIYGTVNCYKEERIAEYAMAAGIASTMVEETINSKISIKYLDNIIKKHKIH